MRSGPQFTLEHVRTAGGRGGRAAAACLHAGQGERYGGIVEDQRGRGLRTHFAYKALNS